MTYSVFAGEPDREEFEHAGLKCLIQRSPSVGVLCGYVGIPPEHPLYGKGFIRTGINEVLDVHGGITFAEAGDGDRWSEGLWWIGFDCAHEGDLIPTFDVLFTLSHLLCEGHYEVDGEVYRNIDYVREQTKKLAEQLHSLSSDTG